MSAFQLLHGVAHCNPSKSSELISCSEAVYKVLSEFSVGLEAALERLFYLVMSCEGLEHKVRRGIIAARDPVKLDLEHNIKKCLDVISCKLSNKLYDTAMITEVLKWCFKTLSNVNHDAYKSLIVTTKVMLSAAKSLYIINTNPHDFVDQMFSLYSMNESSSAAISSVIVKVFCQFKDVIPEIVDKTFAAFCDQDASFDILKSVLRELSKFNNSLIGTAIMDILDQEGPANQKIGFVLNVLRSIPALQQISAIFLNESTAFKQLMNNSGEEFGTGMLDDLARLYMHSEVNSYSTIMTLLEQDQNSSSLELLEKILLNLELAVFGVIQEKGGCIMFIENMANLDDIAMLCKCLTRLPRAKHGYIMSCLKIICVYKGYGISLDIVKELMLTQPVEMYQCFLDSVTGLHPAIIYQCFRDTLRDTSADRLHMFIENAENMKLHSCSDHEYLMAAVAALKQCNNEKLILFLLKFCDPKAIDVADSIFITNILLEVFVKNVKNLDDDSPNMCVMETVGELKSGIARWCPINDCIRLSILLKLLELVTTQREAGYTSSTVKCTGGAGCKVLAVEESDSELHRGQIRRLNRTKKPCFSSILASQSITNLLQCIISNSASAGKQLCVFLLDLLCPDVNVEAAWPEPAAIKYTVERDLNVLNTFQRSPVLWGVLELALSTGTPQLVVIVRALLVVLISHWSSARVSQSSASPAHLEITVQVLDLLSAVEWVPAPLGNVSQLIPHISPHETTSLLFEIYNHFRVYLPHLAPSPLNKYHNSLKETVCLIVQNNIQKLGVSTFLFSRWA